LKTGTKYGVRVHPYAVDLRQDQRRKPHRRNLLKESYRGAIKGWSKSSFRRLQLVALNADGVFASHVTLTYHALTEAWETDKDRNRRVVQQSKADMHRFLMCLRGELGEYIWVQEFQGRGVIHYHLLCTSPVSQGRASEAWARASRQEHDSAVLRHGAMVQDVRSERGARSYLGRYIGKERQKHLPEGVTGAGRWWSRSRGLKVVVLDECFWLNTDDRITHPRELRVCRSVRKYLSKKFGFKYRGGVVFDFGGERLASLPAVMRQLTAHYGYLAGAVDWLMESWPEGEWEPMRRSDGTLSSAGGTARRADIEEARELGGDEREAAADAAAARRRPPFVSRRRQRRLAHSRAIREANRQAQEDRVQDGA